MIGFQCEAENKKTSAREGGKKRILNETEVKTNINYERRKWEEKENKKLNVTTAPANAM